MPDPPVSSDLDISAGTTSAAVRTMFEAKWTDNAAWMQYGATIIESKLAGMVDAAEAFTIAEFVDAANLAISSIPDVASAGAVPSTTITFTNGAFSDSLLDSLKSKLASDLQNASTGLGSAEAALFARETARQNTARSAAYDEVTTQFSSRGEDLPPGALLAKQTEMNNESNLRLSDSSAAIMAKSAELAQNWNQVTVTASTQLLDLIARVFDSKTMRDFEAAKESVGLALEGFKAQVAVILQGSQLDQTKAMSLAEIASKFALTGMDLAVRKYLGEIQVLQSAAQGAQQIVSSALNGINLSAGIGYSASGRAPQSDTKTEISYTATPGVLPTLS